MAHVIGPPCVDHIDQSCVSVCPVDCIAYEQGVDRKAYIDPDACVDCGSCVQVCPNQAIRPAVDLPAGWAEYDWVDAAWFRDPDAARDVLAELLAGNPA